VTLLPLPQQPFVALTRIAFPRPVGFVKAALYAPRL
jgi:hypothetical protein